MRRKLLLFLSLYVNLLRVFLQLPISFFLYNYLIIAVDSFFLLFNSLPTAAFFFNCESFFIFTLAIVGLVEITIRRPSSYK